MSFVQQTLISFSVRDGPGTYQHHTCEFYPHGRCGKLAPCMRVGKKFLGCTTHGVDYF